MADLPAQPRPPLESALFPEKFQLSTAQSRAANCERKRRTDKRVRRRRARMQTKAFQLEEDAKFDFLSGGSFSSPLSGACFKQIRIDLQRIFNQTSANFDTHFFHFSIRFA